MIELAIRSEADGVEITVRDDGPGIAPDVLTHLFEPFFSGRQSGRGLGMGLAKCWRIVTLHGGRIDVETAPDAGTTFRIRLPQS
jgi:C4-dicarboxylate-specific signal transduction histidine kinase